MTLLESIMSICDKQMACADVFCPYLACSFSAHLFNLYNRDAMIRSTGLSPRNLKVNIILVSPPGLSKNESINRFVEEDTGMLTALDHIVDPDHKFSKTGGEISAAGLVGTVDAKGEIVQGDAVSYGRGIIAYTEISSLFVKAEHSKDLINHVLRIAGDNLVVKKLAHGDIHERTFVTLWGGIQPSRIMNVDSSGIERRFVMLFHEWSNEEIEQMVDDRLRERTRDEIETLRFESESLKYDIVRFYKDIPNVKRVVFHFSPKMFVKMPADVDVVEGLSIGYALLTADALTDTLDVVLDDSLNHMLENICRMKDKLKLYENLVVAINHLSTQGLVSTMELYKRHMGKMGYTYSQTKDIITKAYSLGFIDKIKQRGGHLWKIKEM